MVNEDTTVIAGVSFPDANASYHYTILRMHVRFGPGTFGSVACKMMSKQHQCSVIPLRKFRGHILPKKITFSFHCNFHQEHITFSVRLEELVDTYVEKTVKFVYVHWIGESVPFTKKGKFGVVHGSVIEHFQVQTEYLLYSIFFFFEDANTYVVHKHFTIVRSLANCIYILFCQCKLSMNEYYNHWFLVKQIFAWVHSA